LGGIMGELEGVLVPALMAFGWYILVTLAGYVVALLYDRAIGRALDEAGGEFIHTSLLVVLGVSGTEFVRVIRILPAVYLLSTHTGLHGTGCIGCFIAAWLVDVALSYGVTGTPMIVGNLDRARKRRASDRRRLRDLANGD
jgi:hypothetical protein